MKKITFSEINHAQVVDTRLQHDFQKGSIRNALNIPLAKFKKVAPQLLDKSQPIVFLVNDNTPEVLTTLTAQNDALGFATPIGYLLSTELPDTAQTQTKTVPANAFLNIEANYLLLDVRDQTQVTIAAPEKNLQTVTLENLAKEAKTFDPDTPIYTLCGSGNSATTAASYLNKQGLQATVIEGGAKAIQQHFKP